MTQVVNNDKLTFVLTSYGLDRVAKALSDSTVNIYISKIKLGTGDDYEYYEPTETQTDLKGPITGYEFPITDKSLLEDELTVSFHAVIPENFGGYDIREVGLYETVNGVDYLFAISTQQPIVKPTQDDNYLINIDYYIFLKSQNFADIYDSIILDPENQLVTKEDLEDLMSTILFTQGNLIDQIGHNAEVIGLDRASQLHDKISEEIRTFGYTSTFSNYSDLISTTSYNDIFSYWVFNYPERTSSTNSITDISKNGNNLSTDSSINLYTRDYAGFMPMLNFSTSNYFFLSPDVELSLLNSDKTEDIDFSMLFNVKANSFTSDRTLLARSDYSTGTHVFEIKELTDKSLFIRLFADKDNYITYTTASGTVPAEAHVIIISYSKSNSSVIIYINGKKAVVEKEITGTYSCMNSSPTTLYSFAATVEETIYSDSSTTPTALYNSDGTPNTNSKWSISDVNVLYNEVASTYTSSKDTTIPKMYTWSYTDVTEVHSIYVKDETITASTKLYNLDYTEYTGTDFTVVQSGSSYIIQYIGYDTVKGEDIPSKTIYAWVYTEPTKYIWANKNGYNSSAFTVVGSPTITDDGIASGFSSSNYLTGSLQSISNEPFKIIAKVNTGTSGKNRHICRIGNGSGTDSTFLINSYNYLTMWYVVSDGTTRQDLTVNYPQTIPANTDLWVKAENDGSQHWMSISYDGKTWLDGSKKDSTLPLTTSTLSGFIIGTYKGASSVGDLSIDLKQFSITVDGEEVFSGANPPTVLYTSNGNIYTGTDWTISDGIVKYKTYTASYDSTHNVTVPSLGVTSYIMNSTGNKTDFINSYVGIISVMKAGLSEEQLKELSLIFQATLGQNPCIES